MKLTLQKCKLHRLVHVATINLRVEAAQSYLSKCKLEFALL